METVWLGASTSRGEGRGGGGGGGGGGTDRPQRAPMLPSRAHELLDPKNYLRVLQRIDSQYIKIAGSVVSRRG